MELRPGECLLQKTSGPCAVCKKKIEPGPAIQLSKNSSRIRHIECVPKSDSRSRGSPRGGRQIVPGE
jgi:hypothetical protein